MPRRRRAISCGAISCSGHAAGRVDAYLAELADERVHEVLESAAAATQRLL